ncbi:secondary thiamine-phosphate synthase enzyme YjbQ [uncultured Lamprocystis sp.]|jgi:secondary thiamine-phosphate synthase enzyme|uniref:secondary thiamine-phosphate synthase enzyme YjbQ n=1 Tax=uncultured Lamprocystis sp. TaxID=543132 RepID=UPI0025ED541B|nr:secondary thiamine-phosphate synthase enzyme YjbQ [uncultured Lamprocystis sp.]
MILQRNLSVSTRGRGTYDITAEIARLVRDSGLHTGLCHCFLQHTSASLILCENADPSVRRDLESFLRRLVPDGDPLFEHTDEGPDDMPAHLRSILTKTDLTLPISDGRLALGTWQGVYLYEHRTQSHGRRILLTLMGE